MKKRLLFLTVLILCSLSILLIANAQSDPTVVISASQASLNCSTKDQEIEISVLLANNSPLAKDISGVNFALASDSDYLVLDSQASYLTEAFAYETETGDVPQEGSAEAYLYNELKSSAVTYIDSQFVGLKVKGIVPVPVTDTEFVLMKIKATLLANAPAGTYTITASDFIASDTNANAIITEDFTCEIEVVESASSETILYGDANGDGKISITDLVRLSMYLANYNYDTGESTVVIHDGADATGDGKISITDLVRLSIYLANYNYDTGESTVVLGPKE